MYIVSVCEIWIQTILVDLIPLLWRYNERDGDLIHQPHDCLLNRLFRCISKKISNSASLVFVREFTGDRWIPRTKPVTHKKLPFDDVIMHICFSLMNHHPSEHATKMVDFPWNSQTIMNVMIFYTLYDVILNGIYQMICAMIYCDISWKQWKGTLSIVFIRLNLSYSNTSYCLSCRALLAAVSGSH